MAMSRYPEYYKKRKNIDPFIVNIKIPHNIRMKKSKYLHAIPIRLNIYQKIITQSYVISVLYL